MHLLLSDRQRTSPWRRIAAAVCVLTLLVTGLATITAAVVGIAIQTSSLTAPKSMD